METFSCVCERLCFLCVSFASRRHPKCTRSTHLSHQLHYSYALNKSVHVHYRVCSMHVRPLSLCCQTMRYIYRNVNFKVEILYGTSLLTCTIRCCEISLKWPLCDKFTCRLAMQPTWSLPSRGRLIMRVFSQLTVKRIQHADVTKGCYRNVNYIYTLYSL